MDNFPLCEEVDYSNVTTSCVIKSKWGGKQDGSADKGACLQVSRPEFDL